MEIRYHEGAARDIRSARGYLQDRSPVTARKFKAELKALVEKLAEHPGIGFPVGKKFRKAALRTLPWSVIYLPDEVEGILWVMIVRHQAQDSSFGLERRLSSE
jgi:plasmid stabilization system protein ParE